MYVIEYKEGNDYYLLERVKEAIEAECNLKREIIEYIKRTLEGIQNELPEIKDLQFSCIEDVDSLLSSIYKPPFLQTVISAGFKASDSEYTYILYIRFPINPYFNDEDENEKYPLPNMEIDLDETTFTLNREKGEDVWGYDDEVEGRWTYFEPIQRSEYVERIIKNGGPKKRALDIIESIIPFLSDKEIEEVIESNNEIFNLQEKSKGQLDVHPHIHFAKGIEFVLAPTSDSITGFCISYKDNNFYIRHQIESIDDMGIKIMSDSIQVTKKQIMAIIRFISNYKSKIAKDFIHIIKPTLIEIIHFSIDENREDEEEEEISFRSNFYRFEKGNWRKIDPKTLSADEDKSSDQYIAGFLHQLSTTM